MPNDLVDAWRMSDEANRFLLSKVPRESLEDRYAPRTRTVAQQFAHIHAVRLRWLQHAAPALAGGVEPLPTEPPPGKREIGAALSASSKLIVAFLEECEAAGKVKSWKGGPATFLGYMVAHEAHHRGLILVTLRLAGRKLPQDVVYGLWDWGKRSSRR